MAVENITEDGEYGKRRNDYIRLIFDFRDKYIETDFIPSGKEKLVLNNEYLKNIFSGWRLVSMYEPLGVF